VSGVHRAVIAYFVLAFAALIWPVYPLFSAPTPLVLGVPLSLAYVVGVVVLSFFVLLGLYLHDERRGGR
jgi:hypothetical protein